MKYRIPIAMIVILTYAASMGLLAHFTTIDESLSNLFILLNMFGGMVIGSFLVIWVFFND